MNEIIEIMLYRYDIFVFILLAKCNNLCFALSDIEHRVIKDCNSNTMKITINSKYEYDAMNLKLRPIAIDDEEDDTNYYDDINIANDPRTKLFFVETSQRDHLRKL